MAVFPGEHLRDQFLEARTARQHCQMLHQDGTDASALMGIDHDESDLRLARLHHDKASTTDEGLASVLGDFRDDGDVPLEIDIEEEGLFPLGKALLRHKEAPLKHCMLVRPIAASIPARSSGRSARIVIGRSSRRCAWTECSTASGMTAGPLGLRLCTSLARAALRTAA